MITLIPQLALNLVLHQGQDESMRERKLVIEAEKLVHYPVFRRQ
jgi:hypothetical protein